jgi:hypothetical protein
MMLSLAVSAVMRGFFPLECQIVVNTIWFGEENADKGLFWPELRRFQY